MRAIAASTLRSVARATANVPWPQIKIPARARWVAAAAAGALVLVAAGYYGWLRDSSLVAVEQVEVAGLATKDARRIREALVDAGRGMSTLHVRPELLERAVEPYPAVSSVEATTDFPHGLRIEVVEQPPAAVLSAGDEDVAVAADGTLLEGIGTGSEALPSVPVESVAAGQVVHDAATLGAVSVAAAAPGPLARRIDFVAERAEESGIVVRLSSGPDLIFGNAERAEAKWAAAAAALADESSAGARYIDLRLPDRLAIG